MKRKLTRGDIYLIENLKQLLHGDYSVDENPRPKYSDGTPAHTRFITHSFETYNLAKGDFPVTTLMETAHKWGRGEILWIYQDASNSLELLEGKYGVKWWRDWDIGDGTIGHRYGAVVGELDLMKNLLEQIQRDPFGRRHLMNLYQNLRGPGLHPCAFLFELSVRVHNEQWYLDMVLHQRSNDYIAAGYINKSQYVALQMMIAGHLRYHGMDIQVGKFSHLVVNLHIYDRHIDIAEAVLEDGLKSYIETYPRLYFPPSHIQNIAFELKEDKDFYSYNVDDIIVPDYDFKRKIRKPELAI